MELSPPYLLLCVLLILITSKILSKKPGWLPPGPPIFPIIGSILSLSGEQHHSITRLAKLYGPLMTLRIGMLNILVVSSPDAAQQVLKKHDAKFSGRRAPDAIQLHGFPTVSMVWNPPNELWKQLRGLCNSKLFSKRCLDINKPLRLKVVDDLVKYFRAEAGRPVDFRGAAFGAALSLMSITLFSEDMNCGRESGNVFGDLITGIVRDGGRANVSDFFPALRVFDLQRRRRNVAVHVDKFVALIDEVLERRLRSRMDSKEREECDGDFLDYLLNLHDESKMDRKTILVLLMDLFAGALEPTTIILEWAMVELLTNPAIFAKAQAELDETISRQDSKTMDESCIDKLPYLQALIKETLRLHPVSAFFLPHMALEDIELGDDCKYFIPKGTQVLINTWAISRDEKIWPEPNCFKPERFLERQIDVLGSDLSFMPFSSGRRICVGMPLALRMLHLILGSLIHCLNWKLCDGDNDLKEKYATTLTITAPLHVVPLLRK